MNSERRHQVATAVADDFRRIIRVLRLAARRAEQDLGVSAAQLFVLQKLAEKPAESVNDLADRTLTHQSSVSVVVRRLVERRLVAKGRARDDGRRLELRLTPAGKRLLRSVPKTPQVLVFDTVRNLPDRDLLILCRLLHQLAHSVGAARLQPQMLFEDADGARGSRSRQG